MIKESEEKKNCLHVTQPCIFNSTSNDSWEFLLPMDQPGQWAQIKIILRNAHLHVVKIIWRWVRIYILFQSNSLKDCIKSRNLKTTTSVWIFLSLEKSMLRILKSGQTTVDGGRANISSSLISQKFLEENWWCFFPNETTWKQWILRSPQSLDI